MKLSKYFTRKEIACNCGCGLDNMDAETIRLADEIREYCGHPITPSSGCRCVKHNKNEGGSKNSQHIMCRAMDLPVRSPAEVFNHFSKKYEGKYGFGLYNTFIHIDTRTDGGVRWNKRG